MVDHKSPTVAIAIRGLRKTYAGLNSSDRGTIALDEFSLDVFEGEFLTIFGPNGCGKSTLLHILAGLIPWDNGTVKIDGGEPSKVNVGFVFQNFQATLFPWK